MLCGLYDSRAPDPLEHSKNYYYLWSGVTKVPIWLCNTRRVVKCLSCTYTWPFCCSPRPRVLLAFACVSSFIFESGISLFLWYIQHYALYSSTEEYNIVEIFTYKNIGNNNSWNNKYWNSWASIDNKKVLDDQFTVWYACLTTFWTVLDDFLRFFLE